MARALYVIGNWKMYKMAREAVQYIEKLIPLVEGCEANIFLAVPFTAISPSYQAAKNANVVIGAQNMSDVREGAFTGEIGSLMLKEAGASFVLIGHSERRHILKEDDEFIHKKIIRALQDDLQPVLCVGETLSERDAHETEKVLKRQIFTALDRIPKEDALRLILAYEPVWAIGTGKTASSKMAQEAHAFCRECLSEIFGKKVASLIPILYGGSVKPENAKELSSEEDIDGVLVGGASLDPESFSKIVHYCEKKK